MKYLRQMGIIVSFIFFGELLRAVLPFPIPASIYGLAAFFAALLLGVVKLRWVEETADWLVAIMPITFLPVSVELVNDWPILKPFLVPLVVICLASSLVIFGVSGRVTQALMRRSRKKEEDRA